MGNNICEALHVGISVYNMEESIEWYKKNLGYELVKDDYAPPLKARICFIEKDGFAIELFQYDEPIKMPECRLTPNTDLQTVGTKHLAVRTDDMEKLKERFVKNGVDIAHEVEMQGDKVMFIRDNSGVLIEIIQDKK